MSEIKNNSNIPVFQLICRFIILFLIAIVFYSTAVFLTQADNSMNQTKKKAVAPGIWGGTGVNLTVEKEGVKIQYDCAEAEITEKLMIDKKGSFSVEGTYLRHNPGAIRLKFKPKKQPAKFVGKITDKKMILKVILTESDEEIGDHTLQKDKPAKLHRCL
jgi:hypothetical protein